MKRRRMNLILCSLAFITAMFAEVYCFLEFREDVLTVLGTGAIVLVTAFLTLDSILSITGLGDNEDNESLKHLEQRLEEIEKLQKASSIMLKKNVIKQQEMIGKLSMQMAQQKEAVVKTGKLIAKYHREDTGKMLVSLQEIVEKPGFDELGILQTLDTNFHSASIQLDKLIEEITQVKEKIGSVPSNYSINEIAKKDIPKAEEAAVSNEPEFMTAESEEIKAEPEPVPTVDTSDPNKMMSPDDIAALLASMGGEEAKEEPAAEPEPVPTVDTSDPNKMMSPDDIAALLASMGGEEAKEEPAAEPVPTVDTSDPNKMMSPDDIAALFASMGEEEVKEEPVAEPEPTPAVPTIDTSDPNKMMSPDDIAALFASMGEEVKEEPAAEPEPTPAVPTIDTSDPNKMMSPDDIAALLASMGQ